MRGIAIVIAGAALLVASCLVGLDELTTSNPPPNADPQAGCATGCHGRSASNAPPAGLASETDTTAVGVGAHQAHLDPASAWHRPVACADCHRVPDEVGSPGHVDDSDRTAELTFSTIAEPASWDGARCTTACHGSAALGGRNPQPVWTQVDGTQSTCGSCHATPPPSPHPDDSNCAGCHPTMEEGSLTFRDPASHINGVVDFVDPGATGGCTTCHGSTNSAPPKDLSGDLERTAAGVGAHQNHLGPSTWHHEVTCTSCHVVPTTVDAPGHRDGDNIAELTFDGMNPTATYTAATTTCATLYCHGNGRASTGTISWLAQGPLGCTSCHATDGNGMSGDHRKHVREGLSCDDCHRDVVNAAMTIIAADLHIDGVHEVTMQQGTFDPATRRCTNTGCHGTETW